MSNYPVVTWITDGTTASDYRPAIAADGKTIVFERSGQKEGTVLYRLVIGSGDPPHRFLPTLNAGQTRPDWCWANGRIAFNVAADGSNSVSLVDSDGNHVSPVKNTGGFVYPQWDAAGKRLVVMNQSASASPKPCSSVIDTGGGMVHPNVNGKDAAGTPMYGGMPAVSPEDADLIAFAGQPDSPEWGSSGYQQSLNYIFVNQAGSSGYSSNPLEPLAPTGKFTPSFQGRAPAWSPDGRYIVFESDRSGGYALFLFDRRHSNKAPIQLTDPTQNPAQHAKFYPNGTQLIFCANPSPQAKNFGIASIDISQYIG